MSIHLQKSCFYPGETISGTINLQVKNNKISSLFDFTTSIIKIDQYQQYQLYQDNISITKTKNDQILFKKYHFRQYKNRSLLIPLNIPFSIKIPRGVCPTLIYDNGNFIKHYLSIEFPKKCQKTIGIIIQNRQQFIEEKNLSKLSVEKFIDVYKHSFFQKNSKISVLFKTEKNSYAFNEIIPYDIILNCLESDLRIDSLNVSIERCIIFGANDKVDRKKILFKDYKFPFQNKKGIFKISNHFLFPILSDYFSVNPMNIYNYYNKRNIENFEKDYLYVNLFPTCFSSLFICIYILTLEIKYNSFLTKKEILSIPIEIYTPLKIDDEENAEEEVNEINNDINEFENGEYYIDNGETPGNDVIYDDIEINNSDKRKGYLSEFEIINEEDFYKILSDEKRKTLIG